MPESSRNKAEFVDKVGYVAPDYLELLRPEADVEAICALRDQQLLRLFEPLVERYRLVVDNVRNIKCQQFDLSEAAVQFRSDVPLS